MPFGMSFSSKKNVTAGAPATEKAGYRGPFASPSKDAEDKAATKMQAKQRGTMSRQQTADLKAIQSNPLFKCLPCLAPK